MLIADLSAQFSQYLGYSNTSNIITYIEKIHNPSRKKEYGIIVIKQEIHRKKFSIFGT